MVPDLSGRVQDADFSIGRLAQVTVCIDEIRTQIPFTASVEVDCLAHPTKFLADVPLYPPTCYPSQVLGHDLNNSTSVSKNLGALYKKLMSSLNKTLKSPSVGNVEIL